MNRSDLVTKLVDLYPKLSKKEVDSLVKILFSNMVNNIADDVRIEVRGFGCFSLKKRKSGVVRNPRDGISIETQDERHVVYFRAGKELKLRVDKNIG